MNISSFICGYLCKSACPVAPRKYRDRPEDGTGVPQFNLVMTIKKTGKNSFFNVRPELLVCLFLGISILAIYWQVRNYPFVNYDDRTYVTENQHVQDGLTLKGIAWCFTAVHSSNWHPLTWLSHMLDCQLYGMNPGWHHLINVLFHILNTLLLFLVLKRMTGNFWQSSFVAAMFALHPLHVESVAWVAERKDVLSTFFWMMTLWSYTRYVERSKFDRYLLVLLCFILGLMAKPMLVTLPFVLLLLDYWPLNRFQFEKSGYGDKSEQGRFPLTLILEKMPLFVLSAASSVVTYLAQKSSGSVSPLDAIPFKVRIANAMVSYVSYIGKMIWPHNLAVIYPYQRNILLWKIAGAFFLLLAISVVVFMMVKTKPYFAVGWFWYIGTLVPVIGLVQVGSQAMADRYTYMPLIGIFIIIAWGTPDLVPKWRYKKIGFTVLTTSVLAVLMITSRLQVTYWSDSTTLFEHAINATVDNSIAHVNLGQALIENGKIEAANRHFYEALRIKPDLVEPLLNIGIVLREKGNIDEAIDHFLKAVHFKPDCVEAYSELGMTLKNKGDFVGAVKSYLEAIRIKPDQAKFYNNIGAILAHQNKGKEAIVYFNKAIQIDPAYAGAYYNLGKVFVNEGKIEDAILNYRKALSINEDMTQILYHLAWIFATHGDKKYRNGQEAVKLATKLCSITKYTQPLALDALAAAYAETGRFNEAVITAQKALKLALKEGPVNLASDLKNRLEFYQKRRPYRQTSIEKGKS
jgi:tetratricopeptide (TPR) repeat protein